MAWLHGHRMSEYTPACAECPNTHPRVSSTEGCRSRRRRRDINRHAMKVLYFPIKARNVLAQLVAKKGGLTCALETPAWVRDARCDDMVGAMVARECDD